MAEASGATRDEGEARSETPSGLEVRSIDYIPRSERHGKAWHQGPFWFTGNFLFGTMLVGFIGPALGLSLGWTILSCVLGTLFGTFFMAFHANQGPTMGLAQMVQSRAQFGVRGAMVPTLVVIFVYIGYAVFGAVFAGSAVQATLSVDPNITYAVVIVSATLFAIFGYDLLHFMLRWLTYVVVPAFIAISIAAVVTLHPHSTGHGSLSVWLLVFGAAAATNISYAVYVSDYSRYLPAETSSKALISWTYFGASVSAIWMMCIGALIAVALPNLEAIPGITSVGNHVFSGFGDVAVLAIVPSTVLATGQCFYGSMLSGLTIVEALRPIQFGQRTRCIGIIIPAAVSLAVAYALPSSYLGDFNTFLTVMLYLLVPWSAINLVDFYLVRRGHYAVTEIFKPEGIYGAWSKRGLSAYAIGLLFAVPFMTLSFYEGPLSRALGGADITFIVGLLVAGVSYALLTRNFDPATEAEAVAASATALGETPPAELPARRQGPLVAGVSATEVSP